MEFFYSQESLTLIQWTLRAIVGFSFLALIAKLMGQRAISQLRFWDYVIALLIGNIIAHPLSDETLGLTGSIITMTVIMFLYLTGVFLSIKCQAIRKIFVPSPLPLIKNGRINYKNLIKARISIDILLSELRKEKVEDIQKVALALWEPGGNISIFLYPQHQPVTPADLSLQIKPFKLPVTIIKERKIDYDELRQLGKNEDWLLNKIKTSYNARIGDVLLATIDNDENLKIFLYK